MTEGTETTARTVVTTDHPRVLQVITGLAPGGAEEQLRLLVPRLRARGFDCDVAAFYNLGSIADALRADGVRVIGLDSPSLRDPRGALRLTRVIRDGDYDVVHTHLFRGSLHGRVAARRAGVRAIVHTEHSLGPHSIEGHRRNRALDAVYRTAERLGRLTLAVSADTAAQVRSTGVPAHRIRVLPNGIEPEAHRFRPEARAAFRAKHGIAEHARVVTAVGRLVPGKRFDIAIDAMRHLDADLDDTVLLLVGDGSEREQLAERVRALPRRNVVFTGYLPSDEVNAALSAADAFASPSAEEAFGLAVLSALACGLPTVYAASPALDAPQDGTGVSLAAQAGAIRAPSEPTAFAKALSQALRRPRGPGTVGEQYRIDTVADRLAEIYTQLQRGPAPRIATDTTGVDRHE